MVVEGWLARAARTRGEHTALQTPAGSLTYAQLHARAEVVAGELSAAGAAPGTRVAIALPSGLDFAETLHACLLLGAVAVPVDLRLAAAERADIAGRCDLVVEEPLLDSGEPAAGAKGAARPAQIRSSPGTPAAGGGRRGTHDLDAVALLIHTSGTTAAPRPVELTYGNLLWSALGSAVALGRDPDERWLCALPLAHVGGLSILLRSCIYATTAVLHERFELDRALHALRAQDVTLVSLVATTLARLLDAGLVRPPALRCALTGGGPVPGALIARAHAARVPVSLTYGLSESCSQVTTTPLAELAQLDADDDAAGASAGPPLFCTRVRIAADEEILVQGPTVAPAALARDGWLHTGDLGSLDARGRLHVSGRKADTIVSGGENVAPVEVEAVLEAHPGVLEAAVLGRPHERWGEAVTAIVVARPGAQLDAEELRAHCARALAAFKVPKELLLCRGPLPRTRSGKLLRRELAR
jgi:o-succinylbenzoate---CoA ligase